MARIVIFGNSGSGKSTLAKSLSSTNQLAHLDLDTLAWKATTPPERLSLEISAKAIRDFTNAHKFWVVEGCYSDLLELLLPDATEIIFMNLSVTDCIENAINRPWEPHKYESKKAQDANLSMLIEWISQYNSRNDNFSFTAHKKIFETFSGTKKMYKANKKNNE